MSAVDRLSAYLDVVDWREDSHRITRIVGVSTDRGAYDVSVTVGDLRELIGLVRSMATGGAS